MTDNTLITPRAAVFAFLALFAPPALAAEVAVEEEVAPIDRAGLPGFRTELGVQITFGGHSCIGGGSEYAKCFGTGTQWDTSWGLGGGFLARPFEHFSVGFDVSYYNMKLHQITKNTWSDLLLGPTARAHFPMRIKGRYILEPNIGLHAGFVKGTYHQKEEDTSSIKVDYDHAHLGAFVAIPLGIDFFPIPKLGFGLEFKVVRTFYTEVCFESDSVTTCRGVNDEAASESWASEQAGIPGDKHVASYPWKLFWGIHGMYYF